MAAGFRYAYDFDDNGTIDVGSLIYAQASHSATAAVPARDNPSRTIRGYIIDKDGEMTSYLTTIAVHNAAPTASGISGPSVLAVGESADFTLTASDPSPVDQSSNFTFQIDWDNNVVFDQVVTGLSGLAVPHTFPTAGFHTIHGPPRLWPTYSQWAGPGRTVGDRMVSISDISAHSRIAAYTR
jgi:hypothetical protein